MAQSFECEGLTSDGDRYASINGMWQEELKESRGAPGKEDENKPKTWYAKSEAYWTGQSASVNGMLGGLESLHDRDINASVKFINRLPINSKSCVLDVGAGIGRVSKGLLLPLFDVVDMLEQNEAYIRESQRYLQDAGGGRIERRLVCGMQDFRAKGFTARDGLKWAEMEGRYDVVWIQWCIIYLTDVDFVSFFSECAKAIRNDGVICVKDNVARRGFVVDKEDSSVMRSDKYLKHLFSQAGLKVVKEGRQVDFPREIYPVRMYALRPVEETR